MATSTGKVTGIVERAMVKKTYEEHQIEWRIPDITAIKEVESSDYYESPPFIFADVSCCLRLYPKSELNDDFMRLSIDTNDEQDEEHDRPLEFNVCFKKLDGSLEHVISGIVKRVVNKSSFDIGNIFRRSELLRRKSVIAPHHVLTLICKLKSELSDYTYRLDEALSLQLRLDKLSENFKNLFGDKETCDVTLKVKDKEYKAHRYVLSARSSVFAANFKYDMLERQTGVITIPDCDPDSFQKFLEYLYCGKLEDLSPHNAQSLYYTSDKYDIVELKEFCVEYLMQCLTVENMCEIVVFADKYEETQLFSAVQEFFNKNVCAVLESPEWECLLKNDYRLANKLMLQMAKMIFKA